MNISRDLAKQIVSAGMVSKDSQSINEVGGSVRCIDTAGKWFSLEWFHGQSVVTTVNIEQSPHVWIGESESNSVTL